MIARLSRVLAHPIVKGLLARMASLVPSAVATLLASRVIIDHYGIEVFNTYVLAFTTMLLIPLNTLGAGAALTSAVASDGAGADSTGRVALTAARALATSGAVVVLVSVLISLVDGWSTVLGRGADDTAAFGVSLALYGLSFVPALGQAALLGANRNHLNILVQAFLAPAMCGGAALCVALDLDRFWVVVVPGASVLLISLVNALVSARLTGLKILPLLPKVPLRERFPGARIREIAAPALIVTLTAPLLLHSQRLVLSHVSTAGEVAKYSVARQIFAPLVALIPAAASPLWPMFTQARMTGAKPPNLWRVIAVLATFAGVAGVFLAIVANPVAELIGEDEVRLGFAIPVTGVAVILFQAVALPLSMALMYPAGLRLMSRLSLVALPINIALAAFAGDRWGAPGPLYTGLLVAIALQIVPTAVHFQRHGLGKAGVRMAPEDAVVDADVLAGAGELGGVLGGPATEPLDEVVVAEAADGDPDDGSVGAPGSTPGPG